MVDVAEGDVFPHAILQIAKTNTNYLMQCMLSSV